MSRAAADAATLYRLYVVEDRSMGNLAAAYRVGTKTVRGWLLAAGIPIRTRADAGRRRVLEPPPADQLQQLAGAGLSVAQIARRLDVSPSTAARWLSEAGISPPRTSLKNRPRGADRPVTRPGRRELERMYVREGLPIAAIAGRLGVSAHLVRTWLAEVGIAAWPPGGRADAVRTVRWRKPVPPVDELRELHLVRRLGRRALASHYQVHPSTISRWLSEAGLPTRLPPAAGTRTETEMVALYLREALPAAEIARRASVPDSRVLRALRAAGVAIDPGRQAAAVRAAAERRAARPPLPAADGGWAEARYRRDGWSYRCIAEALGVPTGRVRRELARRGVPRRPQPVPGRAARLQAPPEDVRRLYVDAQQTAEDVGAILDIPGRIVLRTGHAHGLPIRQGGRPVVSATVELIEGLYADDEIAAALDRHQVPRRAPGGGIAERFPEPVPLSPELLTDLYTGAGCSSPQIELLTGQPQVIVRARMHEWVIPLRDQHTSPALMRLRADARARFLADVAASYHELQSTTRLAARYGCAPDTARRWLAIAGVRVPGRGRWPRRRTAPGSR